MTNLEKWQLIGRIYCWIYDWEIKQENIYHCCFFVISVSRHCQHHGSHFWSWLVAKHQEDELKIDDPQCALHCLNYFRFLRILEVQGCLSEASLLVPGDGFNCWCLRLYITFWTEGNVWSDEYSLQYTVFVSSGFGLSFWVILQHTFEFFLHWVHLGAFDPLSLCSTHFTTGIGVLTYTVKQAVKWIKLVNYSHTLVTDFSNYIHLQLICSAGGVLGVKEML